MTKERVDKVFEGETRRLLELSGHTSAELQYAHKKVDVLLESYRFGKRRLTAVECKSSTSPISLSETTQIHAGYQPLLTNHKVDEVLIVTRGGLTAAGAALIRDSPGFAHLTFEELANSVLDLSSYLNGLRAKYEHESDGLPLYYIPLRVDPGGDLLKLTLKWVNHSSQPMAVLGAYGSGKSSFALHLVARLATTAARDPRARRPILIRLADVSAEQSLEGLIGRTLGSTVAVPNYSFDRFMALNHDGRFVLVLDGFDEMKRTLSWEEFRYNLGQLNRLVTPRSRVLLLGRPTAFLNDEEYELALHGRQTLGNEVMRVTDWPDYTTHRLLPFTPKQVATFLDGYLRYAETLKKAPSRVTRDTHRHRRSTAARNSRIDAKIQHLILRVQDGNLKEIAKRPVQLKMLAEILPNWKGSLDRLDTTHLFDSFIDLIIARDADKLTRTRFDTKERRAFATALAWWLWMTPTKTRAMPDEIPDEIINRFCVKGDNRDVVRRDLVAACFLDRSHGGPLVFPHRSFQEFLVASYALDLLASGEGSIGDIDGALNQEVADFMYDMAGANELKQIDAALAKYRGALSHAMARLWFNTRSKATWLSAWRRMSTINPWHVQFVTLAVLGGTLPIGARQEFNPTELIGLLGGGMDADLALLVWRCILQLGHLTQSNAFIEAGLKRLITVGTPVSTGDHAATDLPLHWSKSSPHPVGYLRPNRVIATVLHPVTFSASKQAIDLRGSYRPLKARLLNYCWIRDTQSDDGLPSSPIMLKDARLMERIRAYATH
jgi:hypothetical protein